MFQSQPIADRIGRFIREKSALSRLIVINIAVWLVINLVGVIAYLFQTADHPLEELWLFRIQQWFAVPAGIDQWFLKPWTTITYMFLHIDFWHLFFNMLWFYWFGKIFLQFLSNRKMIEVYLIGGIAGAFTFMLAFNFFPAFSASLGHAMALGASASVLAIVVATAVMVPDYIISLLFIGPVKIKYIALITIGLDILMLKSNNAGGHFAHLGGALAGLLYILASRSGKFSFSRWLGTFKIPAFFRRSRVKKVYSSPKPMTDEEYNSRKAQNQKRIDSILDKIAQSGYKSLTEEEKEFLFKFSNK
ncbi:MAG: rhomboid family intramembrane serine protease [Bacteroidetes bacterium]|nr:rhomboid family intramembrane serine protease [Bacteroidota bacterium]